jgi:hypothetical protein
MSQDLAVTLRDRTGTGREERIKMDENNKLTNPRPFTRTYVQLDFNMIRAVNCFMQVSGMFAGWPVRNFTDDEVTSTTGLLDFHYVHIVHLLCAVQTSIEVGSCWVES